MNKTRFVELAGRMINPDQIAYLERDGFTYQEETKIHMSNGITFHVLLTIDEVIELINQEPLIK